MTVLLGVGKQKNIRLEVQKNEKITSSQDERGRFVAVPILPTNWHNANHLAARYWSS
jgi:hypothetical protein